MGDAELQGRTARRLAQGKPPPGNAGVPPAFSSLKELRARCPRSQGGAVLIL